MTIKTIITPSQLTEDQCRQYLIKIDKEGIDFWKTATEDLEGALNDNLRDFGDEELVTVILKADEVQRGNNALPFKG
jgi:hypothetical protein